MTRQLLRGCTLLVLVALPGLASAQYEQGISGSPTPIIKPGVKPTPPKPVVAAPEVAPENDRLQDYEAFITGFDDGAAPPPVSEALPALQGDALPATKAAQNPSKKSATGPKVYSISREVKQGMSVEKGVKVYRGATPDPKRD